MPTFYSRLLGIPFTVRLAATLWVLLLVAVGVRVAFSRPGSQSVVPIYYAAGERWRAGADLYEFHPPDVYRNPPVFAAGFAGLSFLPEKTAGIVWRGAGAAVFLLGLRAFVRYVLPPLSPSQAGTIFAVAMPVALMSVNNGQVNVLLTGAVLFGTAAAARGRLWPAAVWLALAAWLKVYPVGAGLLLCVVFPRLSWRFAVALVVGLAVPFLFQDPGYVLGEYGGFLRYIGAEDRTYSFLSQTPRDWTVIPRMWLEFIPPPLVAKVVSVVAGVLMAGLVLFGKSRASAPLQEDGWREQKPTHSDGWALTTTINRPTNPATARIALDLALIWMTLFGPATEIPTYTLLAPVVGVAVATWRGWRAVAAWVAFGLIVATVARGTFPSSEVLPFRTAMPVAAAFLLLSLISECLPRRSRDTKPSGPTSSAGSVSLPGLGRPASP